MTEITQADRDLFIQINDIRDFDDVSVQRVNEGRWFTHEVELIARHREQAEQETVAKIVADLLKDGSFECAGYVQGKWGRTSHDA